MVVKTEIAKGYEVVKTEPEPLPVQPLVIPAQVLLPPPIETPTKIVTSPVKKVIIKFKNLMVVTEILGQME